MSGALDALDYELPPECIAQEPIEPRDAARLLVLGRDTGGLEHAHVRDLGRWLAPGDLLVRNVTKVLPARLRGRKATGGAAEALLLDEGPLPRQHDALLRCRGRNRVGQKLHFEGPAGTLEAEIVALHDDGSVRVAFGPGPSPHALGETPLPPYIRRDQRRDEDAERYQTVYARVPGSVAAPTAGLHFTDGLLGELDRAGVAIADVVLHVGAGTFRPLRNEDLQRGELHEERFSVPEATRTAVAETRERSGRVIAVGTTSARVLEHSHDRDGRIHAGEGTTRLLLGPDSSFHVVDALLTNFHLPRSSLLLLVAGFAGRDRVLGAYAEAVGRGYRFYSYGDAMLIL